MSIANLFDAGSHLIEHEQLEDFLENASVGIHLVNKDGIILYANKAELDMLGYHREEYFGKNIREFYGQQDEIESILSSLLSSEKLDNHQTRLRCKDGSFKDVLLSSNAYFREGTFIHSRCFTRDITQLKKSEKLLKFLNEASVQLSTMHDTSEALDEITKLIVPSFADWFVINELRSDGFAYLLKMGHANPEKAKWAQEYRTTHPIDINDPKEGSVGWAMRTRQALLVRDVTPEIIQNGAKDKEQRELLERLTISSVMIIPMLIKGVVTGVISYMSCNPKNKFDDEDFSFAKDFTNRIALTLENARLYEEVKKDIEERIEADKKKDEFISIASHELKTPVTSLKAYTQILQTIFENEHNEKASGMLAKMDKQVNKLTSLIVDLLDVTKINKGEMVFDIQEFSFNDLVMETAEEMQRTTQNHTLTLQLEPCEKIKGDRNRIGQVITNFISNAIKYSPEAKEIIITSDCCNHKVKLCVQDFGIGIAQHEHSEVFKRFFRTSAKNQHTFPGMGLGLYISSEIIKRHGGDIYFESTEGKGSLFCFEITSIDAVND
jgi:PAS domain S-box-containing protein